jgi:hypothetical protein
VQTVRLFRRSLEGPIICEFTLFLSESCRVQNRGGIRRYRNHLTRLIVAIGRREKKLFYRVMQENDIWLTSWVKAPGFAGITRPCDSIENFNHPHFMWNSTRSPGEIVIAIIGTMTIRIISQRHLHPPISLLLAVKGIIRQSDGATRSQYDDRMLSNFCCAEWAAADRLFRSKQPEKTLGLRDRPRCKQSEAFWQHIPLASKYSRNSRAPYPPNITWTLSSSESFSARIQ